MVGEDAGLEHPETLTRLCLRNNSLTAPSAGMLSITSVQASKAGSLRVTTHTTTIVNASRIPEIHAGLNVTLVIYFSYSSRTLLRYPVRWTFLRNWKLRGSVPKSLTPCAK